MPSQKRCPINKKARKSYNCALAELSRAKKWLRTPRKMAIAELCVSKFIGGGFHTRSLCGALPIMVSCLAPLSSISPEKTCSNLVSQGLPHVAGTCGPSGSHQTASNMRNPQECAEFEPYMIPTDVDQMVPSKCGGDCWLTSMEAVATSTGRTPVWFVNVNEEVPPAGSETWAVYRHARPVGFPEAPAQFTRRKDAIFDLFLHQLLVPKQVLADGLCQ